MKLSTRDMILIGVFAALMVVGARLSIPTPFGVPLTFQLFFAIYTGLLLTARNAMFSQLIYVVLGLVGVPVFASGGGPQYIFNPTFGFIIGFLVCAGIIGYLMQNLAEVKFGKVLVYSVAGYAAAYLIGNVYFYLIMNLYLGKTMGMLTVSGIMFPYMIKDFVLLVLASYTATLVIPALRRAGFAYAS